MSQQLHVVTGAYGYTGKYIAKRLLAEGHRVRTLTGSVDRDNPFSGQLEAHPFNWHDEDALVASLRGATVLYNTYWVRFNHETFKHASAVQNTLKLFRAAERAGVERIVHTSITNPSQDSVLEYFSGKAKLERALADTGISHAVLRPNVIFGAEDILINNIAWALRKLPVFGVFGRGDYRLQPMYVDDFAALAIEQGGARSNRIIDAIGPETFTYRELVVAISVAIGVHRPIIGVPPWFGYATGWLLGKLVGDVLITREEIDGLMADLLHVDSPPAGSTKLSSWARQHADSLGVRYASELARRRDRSRAYAC